MTASRNSPLSSRWAAFPAAAVLAFLTAYGIGQAWAGEHIKGSGVVRTETRDVNGFRGVALDVPANVTLRQGAGEGVSIKGDDNVVPLVETVVEDGTLRIRWVRRNLSIDVTSLDIVVDAKSIDALAVRGSGQLRAAQLKAGTLHAAVDGSGRITFDTLDVDSLDVAIRGNGRLAAAGRADALDVAICRFGRPGRCQAPFAACPGLAHGFGQSHGVGAGCPRCHDRRLGRDQVLRQAAGHADRGRFGPHPACGHVNLTQGASTAPVHP